MGHVHHTTATYSDTIHILQRYVARRGINYNLDRLTPALQHLNNPHLSLPPTIHIAGTNGKGSVAHYLTHVLAKHHTVFTYTSPHIHHYTERFCINNTPISESQFASLFHSVHQATQDHALSEYEILTLMAFVATQNPKIDILILETGLGGNLDATNVIPKSLSVITDIGLDHTDILGNTLEAIATEKAGIIKPNTMLVTHADHAPSVQSVITTTAKHNNTQVTYPNQHINFQNRNQALAESALHAFPDFCAVHYPKKPPININPTITNQIPPPFGRQTPYTYTDTHATNTPCMVDVGHNLHAAEALLNNLSTPHHWILGMQAKKDPSQVIQWLIEKKQTVSLCRFDPDIAIAKNQLPHPLQKHINEWHIGNTIPKNTVFFGSFFFIDKLCKINTDT